MALGLWWDPSCEGRNVLSLREGTSAQPSGFPHIWFIAGSQHPREEHGALTIQRLKQ